VDGGQTLSVRWKDYMFALGTS